MKHIIRFFFVVSFIVYFTSCNNDRGNSLAFIPPDLSRAEDANVVEISKIEKEVTRYWKIAVADNFIVATGSDLEYTQHLFSKHTGEYLKSFAAIGRGPGEFVMGLPYVHFSTGNDSTYYVVDLQMSTVYTYRIKDITNGRSLPFKFTRLAPVPQKMVGQYALTDIVPQNDRIIVSPANKRRNNTMYRLHDINGVLLDTFAVYPQIDEIKDSRLIQEKMFDNLQIALRPDCKRMVSGTHCGAYMGIYSLEGDSIELLRENRYHIPNLYIKLYSQPGAYSIHSYEDNVTGFMGMTSSQYRIYALYYGRKFSSKDDLYYILEYDWDGNLLKIYKCKKEIIDLQYDIEDNKLYLLYGDSDEGDFRLGYMEV